MMRNSIGTAISVFTIGTLAIGTAFAQMPAPPDAEKVLSSAYTGKSFSPYAGRQTALMPLWGDSHLHTDISMDAGAFGNRLGLDEAYKFARGDEVVSSGGIPVRLSRPLDWLVIADHSDNMGFFPDMFAGAPHIMNDPTGQDWYNRIQAGEGGGVALELAVELTLVRRVGEAPDVEAGIQRELITEALARQQVHLAVGVVDVAVTLALGSRGQDGDPALPHQPHQPAPTACKLACDHRDPAVSGGGSGWRAPGLRVAACRGSAP